MIIPKVVILMKSGREVRTTHDWNDMKGIINENHEDNEMVVQGIFVNAKSEMDELEWVCIKKDCIEGYRNII